MDRDIPIPQEILDAEAPCDCGYQMSEMRLILKKFLTAMAMVGEDRPGHIDNETVLRACKLCDFDPRLLFNEGEENR
jgi:hypothetical protein